MLYSRYEIFLKKQSNCKKKTILFNENITRIVKIAVLYEKIITAGRAKKDMAKMEKHEATIRPNQVCGTTSP